VIRRRWRMGALALLLLAAQACENQRIQGIYARNDTPYTLHFALIGADGTRSDLTEIAGLRVGETADLEGGTQLSAPGSQFFDSQAHCSRGAILAFDASNRLVARRDTPLCVGQTWDVQLTPGTS
jgi:hypothetical protein